MFLFLFISLTINYYRLTIESSNDDTAQEEIHSQHTASSNKTKEPKTKNAGVSITIDGKKRIAPVTVTSFSNTAARPSPAPSPAPAPAPVSIAPNPAPAPVPVPASAAAASAAAAADSASASVSASASASVSASAPVAAPTTIRKDKTKQNGAMSSVQEILRNIELDTPPKLIRPVASSPRNNINKSNKDVLNKQSKVNVDSSRDCNARERGMDKNVADESEKKQNRNISIIESSDTDSEDEALTLSSPVFSSSCANPVSSIVDATPSPPPFSSIPSLKPMSSSDIKTKIKTNDHESIKNRDNISSKEDATGKGKEKDGVLMEIENQTTFIDDFENTIASPSTNPLTSIIDATPNPSEYSISLNGDATGNTCSYVNTSATKSDCISRQETTKQKQASTNPYTSASLSKGLLSLTDSLRQLKKARTKSSCTNPNSSASKPATTIKKQKTKKKSKSKKSISKSENKNKHKHTSANEKIVLASSQVAKHKQQVISRTKARKRSKPIDDSSKNGNKDLKNENKIGNVKKKSKASNTQSSRLALWGRNVRSGVRKTKSGAAQILLESFHKYELAKDPEKSFDFSKCQYSPTSMHTLLESESNDVTVVIPKEVYILAESRPYFAVVDTDLMLSVYLSTSQIRICPPIFLGEYVGKLSFTEGSDDFYLMCVLCTGNIKLWKITPYRCVLKYDIASELLKSICTSSHLFGNQMIPKLGLDLQDIGSLVSSFDIYVTDEGQLAAMIIVLQVADPDAQILHCGKAYVYSDTLKSWTCVIDLELQKKSFYNAFHGNIAKVIGKTTDPGPLSTMYQRMISVTTNILRNYTNDIAAWLQIIYNQHISEESAGQLSRMHCSSNMSASIALDSKEEYIYWLKEYLSCIQDPQDKINVMRLFLLKPNEKVFGMTSKNFVQSHVFPMLCAIDTTCVVNDWWISNYSSVC